LDEIRSRVRNDPLRNEKHPTLSLPAAMTSELDFQFSAALERTGGHAYSAADAQHARVIFSRILNETNPPRMLWVDSPRLDVLELVTLNGKWESMNLSRDKRSLREIVQPEDLAITDVDFAIAETGTIGIYTRPHQPRLLSALPAIHVAILYTSQLVARLADVTANLRETARTGSNIVLITGPSRSGDIEQTLTIGAHGPRAVHVILVSDVPKVL